MKTKIKKNNFNKEKNKIKDTLKKSYEFVGLINNKKKKKTVKMSKFFVLNGKKDKIIKMPNNDVEDEKDKNKKDKYKECFNQSCFNTATSMNFMKLTRY